MKNPGELGIIVIAGADPAFATFLRNGCAQGGMLKVEAAFIRALFER